MKNVKKFMLYAVSISAAAQTFPAARGLQALRRLAPTNLARIAPTRNLGAITLATLPQRTTPIVAFQKPFLAEPSTLSSDNNQGGKTHTAHISEPFHVDFGAFLQSETPAKPQAEIVALPGKPGLQEKITTPASTPKTRSSFPAAVKKPAAVTSTFKPTLEIPAQFALIENQQAPILPTDLNPAHQEKNSTPKPAILQTPEAYNTAAILVLAACGALAAARFLYVSTPMYTPNARQKKRARKRTFQTKVRTTQDVYDAETLQIKPVAQKPRKRK